VDYSSLSKGERIKSLFVRLTRNSGRNNQGRITVRHRGGGEKRLYRLIDWKQDKRGVQGTVEALEYDPYRTAFIVRAVYTDGDRRYLLAWEGAVVGSTVFAGDDTPLTAGMRTGLERFPVGTFVHNVELSPERGGAIVRAAGTWAEVLAHEAGYTHLKLPAGEVRKVLSRCFATIGTVSNSEHNLTVDGKAGRSRARGIRPTVRGSAMNPRDHPYGGGEGRAPRGTRRPKTKWGKITGGRKTRKKKKWSNALIVKRRR
jgi:large subunit ribosomal protein L2